MSGILLLAQTQYCLNDIGMSDNSNSHSSRAFFGRRKGHPLKPRQAALFDTLLPRLALDLSRPGPVDLRTLFAPAVDGLRLEIGFGGAEHLITRAKGNPHVGFIGTEAFVNAIAKVLAAIDENTLTNIRLYFGDASASARLAARCGDFADRPALSGPLAKAAPLEAPVYPG